MNRTFSLSVIAFLLAASACVHAACGGGGYTTQPQSAPVAVERTERQNSTYTDTSKLDTTRFDRVSARLNLTREQSRDVVRMEEGVKREAQDARSTSRSFDAAREFDRRLADILTPEQLRNYYAMR